MEKIPDLDSDGRYFFDELVLMGMFEREPSIFDQPRKMLDTYQCTENTMFADIDAVDEFATRSAGILSRKVRVLSKLLLRFLQEMSVRKKMMKARKRSNNFV